MDLTDSETADSLVVHLEAGGTFASFAGGHSKSAKAVQRRLRSLPDLTARCADARMRGKQLAHNGPLVAEMTAKPAALELRGDEPELDPPESEDAARARKRDAYLTTLEEVFGDTKHPAWQHAARILGAWHLEPAMVRRRKSAELEAEPVATATTRRVFISLPANGTEATPSAPFRGGVIDAEVVE